MATAPQSMSQRNIVDKAWHAQERLEARVARVGRGRYGRVLRMARKPTTEEFVKMSLVAGAGLLILGALGFLIYLIFTGLNAVFG